LTIVYNGQRSYSPQTKHTERMILPSSSQKYVPQSTRESRNKSLKKSDFVEPLQVHDHTCLLSRYLMIANPPQMIMMTINHINVYNAWHNNVNGTRVKHQILLLRGIGSWSRSIVIAIKETHLSFFNMVIKVGISCMAISEP